MQNGRNRGNENGRKMGRKEGRKEKDNAIWLPSGLVVLMRREKIQARKRCKVDQK